MELNSKLFDHTILKPEASYEDVKKICEEALKYDFASVCVNQYRTKQVTDMLAGSDVKVCTVVGFPLGAVSAQVKAYEAELAIKDGATEIDMVINVGALKDKAYDVVRDDIKAVRGVCEKGKVTLKVIIETCLLTDEEKAMACKLAIEAGTDFVKTSTGFSTGGATVEDVKLMKASISDDMFVKASGGVRNYEDLKMMVEAGASRIGASSGVAIMNNNESKENY